MAAIPTASNASLQPSAAENEVPWWLKYAGRGMGTFGGVGRRHDLILHLYTKPDVHFIFLLINNSHSLFFSVAMALGVWTCVTITPICIVAGIWQM